MGLYEVITSRRSIRQFQPEPVGKESLQKMVNAARLAPSAANLQPLEFIVINHEETCQAVFPCLRWAAYITPDGDPKPGREPTAYIVIITNTAIREEGYERDSGAAIENILLTAWGEGIGSCWIISVDRERIRRILDIPEAYKVDSVVALGYPAENPLTEDMVDSVKYWKDEGGRLHVPKRKLGDIIHFNGF